MQIVLNPKYSNTSASILKNLNNDDIINTQYFEYEINLSSLYTSRQVSVICKHSYSKYFGTVNNKHKGTECLF